MYIKILGDSMSIPGDLRIPTLFSYEERSLSDKPVQRSKRTIDGGMKPVPAIDPKIIKEFLDFFDFCPEYLPTTENILSYLELTKQFR